MMLAPYTVSEKATAAYVVQAARLLRSGLDAGMGEVYLFLAIYAQTGHARTATRLAECHLFTPSRATDRTGRPPPHGLERVVDRPCDRVGVTAGGQGD